MIRFSLVEESVLGVVMGMRTEAMKAGAQTQYNLAPFWVFVDASVCSSSGQGCFRSLTTLNELLLVVSPT